MPKKALTKTKKTPSNQDNYFQQAFSWKQEIANAKDRIIALYQYTTIGLLVSLTVVSVSLAVVIHREQVTPFLAMMDKKTGEITTPSRLEPAKMDINWQMVRHFVSNYIKEREGYNFLNIDKPYHTVLAMSSPKVQRQYNKIMRPSENDNSPITVLAKEKYRQVVVKSISKLPSDDNRLIDVRFSVKTIDAISDKVTKTQEYRATLKWGITDSNKSLKEWDLNPIGFTITYYDAQPVYA